MVELGGKMTLMWGAAEEGTINTMLYNAKEREQRKKSLLCNSYKLINEKYSFKVANYEWKIVH